MILLSKLYYFLLYGTTSLEKAQSKYAIKPIKRTPRRKF